MQYPTLATSLLAMLLFSLAAQAKADDFEACHTATNAELQKRACSRVISSKRSTADQRAIAYRIRGRGQLEAGALASAIADLNRAIGLKANDTQALIYRAQAKVGTHDLKGAITDYSAVIKLRPDWPVGHIGRGYVHLVQGKLRAAIADLSQAIKVDPLSASAHNTRGLAYARAGEVQRAVMDYTTAISLNPVYALAYANRGDVREKTGEKTSAIADYRRAFLIDPALTRARDGLERLGAYYVVAAEGRDLVREGKALVQAHCSTCHAIGLKGTSRNPKAPVFGRLHQRHPLLDLREPVTRGIAAPHDKMPKFKLADNDVDRIVAYINSLAMKQ
ncbi:MAG: tetratricopeptide repeat protein [Hyphomicrobiaceae bacterium]